jgi:hypothetical protein
VRIHKGGLGIMRGFQMASLGGNVPGGALVRSRSNAGPPAVASPIRANKQFTSYMEDGAMGVTDTGSCVHSSARTIKIEPDSEDNILWNPRKPGYIKGATIDKLYHKLFDSNWLLGYEYIEYVTAFLLTYRTFSNPHELLETLVKEFDEAPRPRHLSSPSGDTTSSSPTSPIDVPKPSTSAPVLVEPSAPTGSVTSPVLTAAPVSAPPPASASESSPSPLSSAISIPMPSPQRKATDPGIPLAQSVSSIRVCNILAKWLEVHFYDFTEDEVLTSKLLQFIENALPAAGLQSTAAKLKATIAKQISPAAQIPEDLLADAPDPLVPMRTVSSGAWAEVCFQLIDIPPVEAARQLSIIDFELFGKIQPKECLKQSWAKSGKETKAPNILEFIARFNTLSQWASSVIARTE